MNHKLKNVLLVYFNKIFGNKKNEEWSEYLLDDSDELTITKNSIHSDFDNSRPAFSYNSSYYI